MGDDSVSPDSREYEVDALIKAAKAALDDARCEAQNLVDGLPSTDPRALGMRRRINRCSTWIREMNDFFYPEVGA